MPAAGQLIVAHRGASHAAPENTLASFALAWKEGADGVEGDFRLTADGHIVCVHDADTKRTAGTKLVVATSTLAELQKLDVGSWKDPKYAGERIPTLSEMLESLPDGKRLVIELKTGPEIAAPLQQVIEASKVPAEQLVIIAFDDAAIHECKRLMPEIKAHWLTGYKEQQPGEVRPTRATVLRTLKACGADGLGSQANTAVFDEPFIAAMREAGTEEFHVWTVDEPALARFYLLHGAWGITTNRPGWLRQRLVLPLTAGDAAANSP